MRLSVRVTFSVCVWLFMGFSEFIYAQPDTIPRDSLETLIETHLQRDSVRVNALIDIQAHYLTDNHEQGLAYIEEALTISREIDYEAGEGFSLNALAGYYLRRGETDKALEATLDAIELFEDINEDQNIYASFNNLALIYKRMDEPGKAAEVYLDMLDRLEGRQKSPSFVVVYYNLASTYQEMGRMDKYEEWLNKMLNLAEELRFPLGIIEGRLGLAQISADRGEFERAVDMSTSLFGQVQQMGAAQAEARAYKIAATGYQGLGQNRKAMDLVKKSSRIYKEINDPNNLAETYRLKSLWLEESGRWKLALDAQSSFYTIRDSLNTEERMKTIEELQTKYETERIQREKDQAELENLRLEEENRQSRNLLLGSLGVLIFGAMAGGFYTRQQKLKKAAELKDIELKETQKRLAIEQQKREAELKAVRAQMNPHFIFNLMNSVQELNLSGETEQAQKALNTIAEMMQKTLNHSQHAAIPLKDELDLIKLYLNAEQIRFEDKLNYEIMLGDEIEDEFIKIPPMLIQPYVENAVKHGLMHKMDSSAKGMITIAAEVDTEDQLMVVIEDNGVGRREAERISQKHRNQHNQFSTDANEQRLQNISEELGRPAGVKIIDLYADDNQKKAKGTRVEITIPVQV